MQGMQSGMVTKFRGERSACGYTVDVLKSGLQKYIRRGETAKALKMAEELDRFAEVGDGSGERIRTNFIHRIQIIFLEDVGGGNIKLWPQMREWIDVLWLERKKPAGERDRAREIGVIQTMVKTLCASRRTRVSSHMNALSRLRAGGPSCERKVRGGRYEGKLADGSLARGGFSVVLGKLKETMAARAEMDPASFEVQMCVLLRCLAFGAAKSQKNRKALDDVCFDEGGSGAGGSGAGGMRFGAESRAWFKDIGKLREGYLLYFQPLADYLFGSEELQTLSVGDEDDAGAWPCGEAIELDEYVYDKHVRHAKHREPGYFSRVSAVVTNEVVGRYPPELKKIYGGGGAGAAAHTVAVVPGAGAGAGAVHVAHTVAVVPRAPKKKLVIVDELRETDFDFVARAQLTCSASKADTYFAKREDGSMVFIKGPFASEKACDDFIAFQQIKHSMGIPCVVAKKAMLVMDRWPEGVPLGLRTKLSGGGEARPFLVCESLLTEEQVRGHLRAHPGSRLWPATEVVDFTPWKMDLTAFDDVMWTDYLNALGFRLQENIGDLADRNFMVVDGRVYSVDEERTRALITLERNLSKSRVALIKGVWERMRGRLHAGCAEALSVQN